MVAAIYRIGSTVEVVLMRKRFRKRARKEYSVPLKSSVRDALKSIRSRYNQPPKERTMPAVCNRTRAGIFWPGKQLRLWAQLR